MLWIELLSLPVLGMIAWEDLHERSIHWWWLPALAAVLLLPSWTLIPQQEQVLRIGYNLGFLALQLGATYLLLMLRHGRRVDPLHSFIGLGDILFFVVLALGLSWSNFILFLISGLALCVPAYLLLVRLNRGAPRTVPAAGFLALYLAPWCALDLLGVIPDITTGSMAEHLLAHAG